jgi:hypothetical protein
MFGARNHFLDRDVEDWHRACWAWLLRNLGGIEDLKSQRLILPNAEFFPPIRETGHARAEAAFANVKALMGLEQWPCELVAREDTNAQIGEFLVLQPRADDRLAKGQSIGGTFQTDEHGVVVTYNPALLDRPGNLVATLAHELAHYVLHTIQEPPPGADVEPGLEELATELAVAYHGFGVIAANAAFDFSQHQDFGRQGWRGGASGYFSEEAWVFALAVFMALRGDNPAPARAALKPHLAKKLDAAIARLAREPAFLQDLANSA